VLADLLREAGFPAVVAEGALAANTAREVFQRLDRNGDRGAFQALTCRVARRASTRVQGAVPVEAVLFGYDKGWRAECHCPAAGK